MLIIFIVFLFSLKNGSKLGGIILSFAVVHEKDGCPTTERTLSALNYGSLSIISGVSWSTLTIIPGSFSGKLKNVDILSELIIASDVKDKSIGNITIAKLKY